MWDPSGPTARAVKAVPLLRITTGLRDWSAQTVEHNGDCFAQAVSPREVCGRR